MKLFVAMLSLTLFVCVLRSPSSASLAPDVSGVFQPQPTASGTLAASTGPVTMTTPTRGATTTPAATPVPTPPPTAARTTPPPARTCTTACQIRGRVSLTTGAPVANARVNVYRAPENTIVGSTVTDVSGN